jgi:aryl-alcohol dehydrogenase
VITWSSRIKPVDTTAPASPAMLSTAYADSTRTSAERDWTEPTVCIAQPPLILRCTATSSANRHSLPMRSPRSATPLVIPKDVPLELIAPVGCGLQTGAGAVLNSLQVAAGSSIAIIGTGAVGLAAVMAARVAGAATIVAVDVNAQRLILATELGATHTINAREQDVASQLAKIVRGGVDYILEITGRPEMLAMAVDSLAHMGTVGLIGGAPAGTKAPIDMLSLAWGRHLRGIMQGDAIPQLFIPQLVELHRSGKFPFERLVRFYELEAININQAFADSRSGEVLKPVLRIGEA